MLRFFRQFSAILVKMNGYDPFLQPFYAVYYPKSGWIGPCQVGGNAPFSLDKQHRSENLHLSYREVVHEIPYRCLIIMKRDKLHVVYGESVKKASGKDMVKRKR